MKKASKVFIWLGMIFQFFLIYPIVIGILALKKIDTARTKNDLQNLGIITTLFCSLLGGVFMLCIEDSDLCPSIETITTKKTIVNEQSAIIKKSKKSLLLKIFSIIGITLTFAASIVFFFLTINSVYVPWRVDISKDAEVIYDSCFTLFLIFTIVFLLATVVLYYIILKQFKCNKKAKIIAISIFAFIYLLFPLISIPVKVNNIQDDLKSYEIQKTEEIERNTLKYTNIKISDLLSEVKRYPSKYNNTIISLEGYVRNEKINSFNLVFPGGSYYYDDYITINYIYDSNNPRVFQGDYVVVTGTIEVSTNYYDTELIVEIINATCEIKESN